MRPASVSGIVTGVACARLSDSIVCGRIKTSKAKIGRARLGKGGGGSGGTCPVSPQPLRVFRISFY